MYLRGSERSVFNAMIKFPQKENAAVFFCMPYKIYILLMGECFTYGLINLHGLSLPSRMKEPISEVEISI
jgi:hypothetical protein